MKKKEKEKNQQKYHCFAGAHVGTPADLGGPHVISTPNPVIRQARVSIPLDDPSSPPPTKKLYLKAKPVPAEHQLEACNIFLPPFPFPFPPFRSSMMDEGRNLLRAFLS